MSRSAELRTGGSPGHDRPTLLAAVAAFQTPSLRRSLLQIATSILPLLAVNGAMYAALRVSVWLTLALAFPAAGLLIRVFIIQHDCGHGAFFASRRLNDALGRFCSVLTFTPYAFWRRQHALHHAGFNNLDRRDTGLDIYSGCATLREYTAFSPARRLLYRLSRHPAVAHILIPPLLFLALYRVPFEAPQSWRRERLGVYGTDCALACLLGALAWVFGLAAVATVQLPVIALTSIAGVWLFTVQHRWEQAQWMRQDQWTHARACMEGSSHLKLPRVLRWLTGNIGLHHIHHLAVRIPNYRLQDCHDASPELAAAAATLTLGEALRAPCYALWDEDRMRMVRFPNRRPAA